MSRWSALLCLVLSQTVTGDLNTQEGASGKIYCRGDLEGYIV